jgi:hypothetical protein
MNYFEIFDLKVSSQVGIEPKRATKDEAKPSILLFSYLRMGVIYFKLVRFVYTIQRLHIDY